MPQWRGGCGGGGASHPNLGFARETGKAVLEDSGTGGVWPMPVGVTLSLLIRPQDDDAVPPGMESLISAPLVKTLQKEEEQVGLWGGPSEFGGMGSILPSSGFEGWGGAWAL